MAGAKTSNKNARAGASKATRPVNYGEIKFIIPCNGGKNAYLFDPATSKNPNLATSGAEFSAAVGELVAAGYGAKVNAELEALAEGHPQWTAVKAKLIADGVLA